MFGFRLATNFFVLSDIHLLISSFQPVRSSAGVGIDLSSTLSVTDQEQMASSQPHLKLKVRGRPRYRAWQSREAFLLRHCLRQRPPHSPLGHIPGNHDPRDDRSDFYNETRNSAAEVDAPTSFGSHSSSNRNPYSGSSRSLSLAMPKRRRLSENEPDQNQQRPPTKRRRVSEGGKSKELLGQQFIPITQVMPTLAQRYLLRESQRQVTRNDRSDDSFQSPRRRPRPASPLGDSAAENKFDQGFMRDDRPVEDLAAKEGVESEDKVVDSLVLCDDQEPHNNDRTTSLRPNTRTSISSVLFDCFLIVLNITIWTYLYRQTFPYKPFHAVNWYEQAIDIAFMKITVSRVVLFGEAALEPMRWKGQPGLLPDPEATLDAGSTDDEWDAYIDSDVPDSTILGMSPHDTGTPSPTARPREPRLIMNTDPPLSRLEILVKDIMSGLTWQHITRITLADRIPGLAWSRVTVMWFNFDLLLRDQRTTIPPLGDHRPIPTSGRPQDLSDVPGDVPEDYLDKVFRAHYSKISSHNSEPTSNSKRAAPSSTVDCHPPKHPTPKQWSLNQVKNATANRLIKNAFHHHDLDLGQKRLSKLMALWGVVEYSDILDKACGAMDEINQRIGQVLSADYNVDHPLGGQIQAVDRLRQVAPFLSDIAAIRLREMSRRASRGALLVREIDRRQHKLAEDILGGFVTADFLLHFPPIEGLLVDMELMAEWFKTEVASITNLWESRSEKFDAAMRRDEEQGNHGMKILWTRWGVMTKDLIHGEEKRSAGISRGKDW
ncbi:hypothetical protein FPCIR_6064 [Fusarium pseudocircinatum]|uniref:Uncharacterized protein n=1 Tax=Fusarium pseudocircinatum TaxID=56676 RepID=A0A8H5UIZ5_9HYPO|nr:hypothetical protein FPCIR_6064 [Fusarium pseudocircinatum]